MSTIPSDTGRPYPATPGPVRNDVVVAQGDVFLSDGAKRDRYDWGGDNVVSNVVSYLTTGQDGAGRERPRVVLRQPEPGGPDPRRLPAGAERVHLQLGRVRRLVDAELLEALPLHR
ncbi:hypothetical protein [Nocardioides sp. TF02-7]|uniref:hypothetical protein n=1 Tax=Nocardioides sp. TF02-7 TaxID=2917724 RepID=UPI001F06E563|nr:hypothetical protein [Nocardioides sp. TF02-7]UMG92570.1 hypothetical protein MF408_22650 [Nocardioides sp. TF02-7]